MRDIGIYDTKDDGSRNFFADHFRIHCEAQTDIQEHFVFSCSRVMHK